MKSFLVIRLELFFWNDFFSLLSFRLKPSIAMVTRQICVVWLLHSISVEFEFVQYSDRLEKEGQVHFWFFFFITATMRVCVCYRIELDHLNSFCLHCSLFTVFVLSFAFFSNRMRKIFVICRIKVAYLWVFFNRSCLFIVLISLFISKSLSLRDPGLFHRSTWQPSLVIFLRDIKS